MLCFKCYTQHSHPLAAQRKAPDVVVITRQLRRNDWRTEETLLSKAKATVEAVAINAESCRAQLLWLNGAAAAAERKDNRRICDTFSVAVPLSCSVRGEAGSAK